MNNQEVINTLRLIANINWKQGSFTTKMVEAMAKAAVSIQREEKILEEIEALKDSFMKMDDRTFSNQVTEKGFYVDGAYDFYKKVKDILTREGIKND